MAFKFNPFTGQLDLVGSGDTITGADNFSYVLVESGTPIAVPAGQEMLHEAPIVVDGELTVDGATSQVVDYSLWSFGWNTIPSAVTLAVRQTRDFLFVSPLTIDGSILVDGRMIEVA